MLEPKRANRVVACLVCWTCHSRMGPNHFTLKDGGAVCGLCQTKNPLGNLQKMSIQEVTEPSEISSAGSSDVA
jgi:recombinational DNA repair protein (RecF pathway)